MNHEEIAELKRMVRELSAERDALQLQVAELSLELRDKGGTLPDPDATSAQLFDERWYREQYPDVDQLGMDAREHYDWVGRRLGRAPNARATKKKVGDRAGYWRTLP